MTLKAEIHPSDNLIKLGESRCVSIRHMKKHARVRHIAAAMLSNVEITPVKARGNLTGEFEDAISWDSLEIPEAIKSKFRKMNVNFQDAKTKKPVTKAKVLVAIGKDYFYLP